MQDIVIAKPYRFVPPYTGNFWTYPLRWWLPGKVRPLPILLFGKDYWNRVVNFEAMVEEGVIAPHDLDLLHWSEDANEAWDYVTRFYEDHPHPMPVQTGPSE